MSRRATQRAALVVVLLPLLLLAVVAGTHRDRTTAFASPPRSADAQAPDRAAVTLSAEGLPRRAELGVSAVPEPPAVPSSKAAPAPAAEPDPRIAGWIRDLASDDVPGNAGVAARNLGAAGDAACAQLEAALDSPDDQQRFLAAHVLRTSSWWSSGCSISDRLLEVTAEGLRDDRWRERTHPFVDNATEGVEFLIDRGERAWSFVYPALSSSDRQERFLAAVVLGYTGCPWSVERTAVVLADNMNDDMVKGNAVIATSALLGLGAAAADSVEWIRRNGDAQAATLARIVQLDLASPPQTGADHRARRAMHAVSRLNDPAQLGPYGLGDWVEQLEDRLPR